MSKSISETASQLGNKVAETAQAVGSKVAKGAADAVDFVKEKTGLGTAEGNDVGIGGIKEHKSVFRSCGKTIGSVDHLEASAIKLTRKDSPDGQHHCIPQDWVALVSRVVNAQRFDARNKGCRLYAQKCSCAVVALDFAVVVFECSLNVADLVKSLKNKIALRILIPSWLVPLSEFLHSLSSRDLAV